MKKFLAKLMAIVMMVSLLPAYAFAADGDTAESVGTPLVRTQLLSYVITEQDGKPVLVGVSTGTPAHLMVVDLTTRETLYTEEIENGLNFYAYTKDSKGDVYFAGYTSPITLYKYSVTEKKVTELGSTSDNGFLGIGSYEAKAVCDMTVDEDDNVYLGTYPKSGIMKWDGSEISKVATNVYSDDDYTKFLCYYDGSLWAGGNKEGTKLVQYNLSNVLNPKTTYEVNLPEGVTLNSMYQASIIGDRLFIFCKTVSSGYYMAVFDLTNKEFKEPIAGVNGSYAISGNDGYAYFSKGGKLQKYDLSTDTYEQTISHMDIGNIPTKYNAVIDGKTYIAYNPNGRSYVSLVDLAGQTSQKYEDALPKFPDSLESIMIDSEGKLYASAYQGSLLTRYDTETQEVLRELEIGQSTPMEEIDGKIYFATYPNGDLIEYDPSADTESDTSKDTTSRVVKKLIEKMPDENQPRPMEIVKANDKLIVSAVGGYADAEGKSSGYIVIYDTSTGYYTKYKGGVMADYHMVGLYYDDDKEYLYVTTTVHGGHNAEDVHDKAVIFKMAPDVYSEIKETTTVEFTGGDNGIIEKSVELDTSIFGESSAAAVKMCGGLAKDPAEDKLWCACYSGVFSIDMSDLTIGDYIPAGVSTYNSRWQPYQIEFNSAGELYATPGNNLVKIDTAAKTYTKLADNVFDMALYEGKDGTAVYTMAQKETEVFVINKQEPVKDPELVDGYYQITSFDDFMFIKDNPTASYKLMNDITVGTADEPFTEPFDFQGVFDGNGHTIDVNIQAAGSVGLFASQAKIGGKVTIKNLTLTGSVKKTDTAMTSDGSDCSVGSFIGYAANHTTVNIENCVNKATVDGGTNGLNVGGIIGKTWGNYPTVIKNTKNYGKVSSDYASSKVGGIAGVFSGTITECANGGDVTKPITGSLYSAGLVSEMRKGGLIEKSANFGSVTGIHAAGLVGQILELDSTSAIKNFIIENSFNAGEVTASEASGSCCAAGLLGTRADSGSITTTLALTNSYNVGVITGGRKRIFVSVSGDQTSVTPTNVWFNTNYGASGFSADGNKEIHQFSTSQTTVSDLGFPADVWTWDTSVFEYPYITSVGVMPDGTANRPYEITSFEEFKAIKDNNTACYKLMNDITVGTADEPFTEPFDFQGVFDGNGHTIDVNIQAEGSAGLFASQSKYNGKVTIKNLTLTGSVKKTGTIMTNVNSGDDCAVGAFIGDTNDHSIVIIENCINKASVDGGTNGLFVGGIVGRVFGIYPSVMKNTKNYGSVTGTHISAKMGGLAGQYSGTITECANGGTVTKPYAGNINYVGGLVGEATKGMLLEKSANFGEVTAACCGGLVGNIINLDANSGVKSFTIENSFNAGAITTEASGDNKGASGVLCNKPQDIPLILTNVYNAGVVSGARTRIFVCYGNDAANITPTNLWYDKVYTAAGVGTTGYSMFSSSKNTLDLIGFDSSIWTWNTDIFAYPYITSVGVITNGAEAGPFSIRTKEDFMKIKDNPTATYYLENDIDLGSYEPFEFRGCLKGKVKEDGEYTAINVNIDMPDSFYVGLFSNIDGYVRIENIKVTGSINANAFAGGIAGYAGNLDETLDASIVSGSYIKNCVNEADVTVDMNGSSAKYAGERVGGILGSYRDRKGRNLTLTGLENRGNITASEHFAGGIVGFTWSNISDCINTGAVNATSAAGGIAGLCYDSREVKNCYNSGNISGSESIGGIAGRWTRPNSGTGIVNCYNTGDITSTSTQDGYKDRFGSIVGHSEHSEMKISNSYNAGRINGHYIDKLCGIDNVNVNPGTSTATNVYSLTVDGDEDDDTQTIGIAGLEAAAAALGDGFAASANAYPFPQISGNINNEVLDILMIENLTLDVADNGAVSAGADIATNLSGKDVMFVLAVYDGDKLVKIDADTIKPIGKTNTGFECAATWTDGETVKLYVWDSNLTPYCNPTVYPAVQE